MFPNNSRGMGAGTAAVSGVDPKTDLVTLNGTMGESDIKKTKKVKEVKKKSWRFFFKRNR